MPKQSTNYFHHSKIERRVYAFGVFTSILTALVLILLLLWSFPLAAFSLGGILIVFALFFGSSWLGALTRVGHTATALVFFSPWNQKTLRWKDITSWKWNPSRGQLNLYSGEQSFRVSMRLGGFPRLRDLIIPHLSDFTFQEEELPIKLRISGTAFFVYVFFVMAILFFGFLWTEFIAAFSADFLVFFWGILILLVLILITRMAFFLPSGYTFSPKELIIHYLFRKQKLSWCRPVSWKEDTYAKGGVVYYLQRIHFPEKKVVMDEMYLDQSLWRLRNWIKKQLEIGP